MNAAEDIVAAKVATELKPSDLVKIPAKKAKPSNGTHIDPVAMFNSWRDDRHALELRIRDGVYIEKTLPPAMTTAYDEWNVRVKAEIHGGGFAAILPQPTPEEQHAADGERVARLTALHADLLADLAEIEKKEDAYSKIIAHAVSSRERNDARNDLLELQQVHKKKKLDDIKEAKILLQNAERDYNGEVIQPPGPAKFGSAEP